MKSSPDVQRSYFTQKKRHFRSEEGGQEGEEGDGAFLQETGPRSFDEGGKGIGLFKKHHLAARQETGGPESHREKCQKRTVSCRYAERSEGVGPQSDRRRRRLSKYLKREGGTALLLWGQREKGVQRVRPQRKNLERTGSRRRYSGKSEGGEAPRTIIGVEKDDDGRHHFPLARNIRKREWNTGGEEKDAAALDLSKEKVKLPHPGIGTTRGARKILQGGRLRKKRKGLAGGAIDGHDKTHVQGLPKI